MGLTKLALKFAAPYPKVDSFERYLFVGPHPDDIEIGAGGLVSKFVRNNKEVYFLICTDGACGSDNKNSDFSILAETRKKEAKEAATFLGAKDIFFLNYPDGKAGCITLLFKAIP